MTKAQMQAVIEAQGQRLAAFAAPAATVAPVPAPVPWVEQAKTAAQSATAPAAPKTPKPLKLEVLPIRYDPARHSEPFAPYNVLHIHNGCNGTYYKGVKVNARQLAVILAWIQAGGKL